MTASKQCPDCAEHVQADARKCRYCGYRWLPAPDYGPPRVERTEHHAVAPASEAYSIPDRSTRAWAMPVAIIGGFLNGAGNGANPQGGEEALAVIGGLMFIVAFVAARGCGFWLLTMGLGVGAFALANAMFQGGAML